jgi:hypothetical protein
MDADDGKLDAALSAKRACEDKLAALRGAALSIGKEISAIEAQIDKVVDQRCRAETSVAVNAMADRLAKAQAAHEAAASELESAAREAALLVLDGHPVSAFVMSARQQLRPAVEVIVTGLRNHVRGVLAGTLPPSLPKPEREPVKLAIVPPPEMLTVFILKNTKYLDATGAVTCVGANRRHDLPRALAELALSSNLALPISDKRCRDLEWNAVSYTPEPQSCSWLGPVGQEGPAKFLRPGGPVQHSAFEPMDRGKPFTVTVPGTEPEEPMPVAVGMRKAEESES